MKGKSLKISGISHEGTGVVNEDIFGQFQNHFWVFDGATPIVSRQIDDRYKSQAEWLVHEFQKNLISGIEGNGTATVKKLLSETVRNLKRPGADAMGDPAGESPSMTLGLVKIEEHFADIYVIGDCSIYVLLNNGSVRHVTDRRVKKYSHRTLQVFIRNRGSSHIQKLLADQRMKNQSMLNRLFGYWVANENQNWIRHVKRRRIPLRAIKSLLICSDGFDRIFELYKQRTVESILNKHISLEAAVGELRALEKRDRNCTSYPRLKVSDDATAVLLHEE